MGVQRPITTDFLCKAFRKNNFLRFESSRITSNEYPSIIIKLLLEFNEVKVFVIVLESLSLIKVALSYLFLIPEVIDME